MTGLIIPDAAKINAAMREGDPHRIHPTSEVTVEDNRAQERQEPAQRAATATNVRNLAGACWWQGQAAEQRGDHTEAARLGIARGRVLAEAKRQGLAVGV